MKISASTSPSGTIRDWLDHRALEGGVAVVFAENEEQITWKMLRENARELAMSLAKRGVEKGESVAIVAPNGPFALTAFYAVVYGGFRATMINLAAGQDAMSYALTHSEARLAFVHSDCEGKFDAANSGEITPISTDEKSDGIALPDILPTDQALLMYTSGTTGTPKGVVHTHASLLAGGWTTAIAHDLGPGDRGFCALPIYHINGLCVTVMGSLVSNGSLAMTSRFSASKFWDQVSATGATWFSVVPTIISHLLHGSGEPNPECKDRLRFGRSASSALAVETQTAFETRFGVPIVETMGLTETAAQILSNPLPPMVRKIGSPGRAFGCEVKIHSDDGLEVKAGDEGEIVVRGPNVMREYLKNPLATGSSFRKGWLRTGDLGRVDADGFVFVTGRLKELIIKGGENIAPREIDEALYAHPDVVEAAAFARPCNTYGERVEAAVALRVGSEVTAIELVKYCATRVGDFKAPEVIYLMDELPKGPSGKIQRLKLAGILSQTPERVG